MSKPNLYVSRSMDHLHISTGLVAADRELEVHLVPDEARKVARHILKLADDIDARVPRPAEDLARSQQQIEAWEAE